MNTPELSIIIPVYQANSFLRACIESILSQDFQEYELLLIDDGSDDGGEQICDEYAGKDARIFTFHQKNQGVSAARNLGLCHARGEYICFVDADDSLEHTLLSQCMTAVKETSADLLHHGMTEHLWRNGTIINSVSRFQMPFEGFCDLPKLKELVITHYTELSVHVFNYIFKKQVIHELRFEEYLSYSEDTIFVNQALAAVKNCYFLDTFGYQYNARTGSAAHRWQPEILTCYEKTFDTIQNLLKKWDVSNTDNDHVMGPEIMNAYSALLYNLCLPGCHLKLLQKRKLAQQARKTFQIKKYMKLYSTKNLRPLEKVIFLFVKLHMEGLLLFLGTRYERIVTNGDLQN